MSEGPKTRDGVPFELGMTLVSRWGREHHPNEAEYELDSFEHPGFPGHMAHTIGRKGSGCGTDVLMYYSSHEARIKDQVAQLESVIRDIRGEIEHLKEGGDPEGCVYLNREF